MFLNFGTKLIFLIEESFFSTQKTFQHYNRRDEENDRSLLSSKIFWFLFWFFWMSDHFFAIAFLETLFATLISYCNFLTATVKRPFLEFSTRKLCSHPEIYPGFLVAFVCKNRNSIFFFLPVFSKSSNLFIYNSPISKKLYFTILKSRSKQLGRFVASSVSKNDWQLPLYYFSWIGEWIVLGSYQYKLQCISLLYQSSSHHWKFYIL